MKKSQIVIDNTILNYYSFQGTSDFFVLFLHGWARSGLDWELFFEPLISKGISFAAIDFPGFGFSSQPGEDWGIPEYSKVVSTFIEKLGWNKKIICVAHSFGGRVAFYLAAQYPHLFEKLLLAAPGGIENTASPLKKHLFSLSKKLFSLPGLKSVGDALRNKLSSSDYHSAGKLKNNFVRIVNYDQRATLSSLTIPTVLFWGTHDDQILERQIALMGKTIPHVEVKKYAGIGHDVHKECFVDVLHEIYL